MPAQEVDAALQSQRQPLAAQAGQPACLARGLDAFYFGVGDVVGEEVVGAEGDEEALIAVCLAERGDCVHLGVVLCDVDDFGVGVEGDIEDLDLAVSEPTEVIDTVGVHPQGLPKSLLR